MDSSLKRVFVESAPSQNQTEESLAKVRVSYVIVCAPKAPHAGGFFLLPSDSQKGRKVPALL